MLWPILALLTLAVLLLLIWPLLKDRPASAERAEFDLEVYRDQLGEVAHEAERGTLSAEEAAAARLEIERRMLRADAERSAPPTPRRDLRLPAAIALALLLPIGSTLLYLRLGAPNLPAQPLASRGIEGPANAGKPGEPGGGQIADLVGKLESRLATQPGDVQGWALLGRSYLMLDRPLDAVGAFAKAAELDPRDPELSMGLAESQVFAAQGQVTPKARAEFDRTLSLDPKHPGARYYAALAKAQAGDLQAALNGWLDLHRDTPADAPWKQALEARLSDTAKALKVDLAKLMPAPAAPPRASEPPRGPSAEDMAAAAQMSEGDRNEMIRGMVQRLADRLQENPADYEGWMRLGRAYMVLNDQAKAREAFQSALRQKPGDAAAGQALAALGPGSSATAPAAAPSAAPPGAEGAAGGAQQNEMIRAMVERLAARMKDNPNDAEGWSRLGQSYAVLGRWQDAEAAYGKAAALLPNDANALINHGAAIAEAEGQANGLPERAEILFRRALAINPENLDALWYVGVAEMQARRPKVALVYWEKLIGKLDPKSAEYQDVRQGIEAARRQTQQ